MKYKTVNMSVVYCFMQWMYKLKSAFLDDKKIQIGSFKLGEVRFQFHRLENFNVIGMRCCWNLYRHVKTLEPRFLTPKIFPPHTVSVRTFWAVPDILSFFCQTFHWIYLQRAIICYQVPYITRIVSRSPFCLYSFHHMTDKTDGFCI